MCISLDGYETVELLGAVEEWFLAPFRGALVSSAGCNRLQKGESVLAGPGGKDRIARIAVLDAGPTGPRFIRVAREWGEVRGEPVSTAVVLDPGFPAPPAATQADDRIAVPGCWSAAKPEAIETLVDALGTSGVDAVWTGPIWQGDLLELAERCAAQAIVVIGTGEEGLRLVGDPGWLANAAAAAGVEVAAASGVGGGRRFTVDLAVDGQGTIWTIAIRSQLLGARRNPVEEAPYGTGRGVPSDEHVVAEQLMHPAETGGLAPFAEAAGTIARLLPGTGLVSVSFVQGDPGEPPLSALVGCRLGSQLGHIMVESVSGMDLMELQLRLADGGRLEGQPPRWTGRAIAGHVRCGNGVVASRPPREATILSLPVGPGIHVEVSGVEGESFPVAGGPGTPLASVVGWGIDRAAALTRTRAGVAATTILVGGGTTNKTELLRRLGSAAVSNPAEAGAAAPTLEDATAWLALLRAAVDAYEADLERERVEFFASAARGRPEVDDEVGRTVELGYLGEPYRLRVRQMAPADYRIDVDGRRFDVTVDRPPGRRDWLACLGRRHMVVSAADGPELVVEVDGFPHRISREDMGVVRSPSPAVVVAVRAREGEDVEAGDPLVVVEAMKMEMTVTAPFAGRVRQVFAVPNEQVDAGEPLLQIASVTVRLPTSAAGRVRFPEADAEPATVGGPGAPAGGSSASSRATLDELRRLVLGYDVEPADAGRLVSRGDDAWEEHPETRDETRREEDELLELFADVSSLFADQDGADLEDADRDLQIHGPQDDLLVYLRTLDPNHRSLGPLFGERLGRALRHYGVAGATSDPKLRDALFRLFRSHRRVRDQAPAIAAILDRRLAGVESEVPQADEQHRGVLERIVAATRAQHPDVADLARQLGYALFDQPGFEQARDRVYRQAEEDLAALAARPPGPDVARRLEALVQCPQPLQSLLTARLGTAADDHRAAMLEVMVRRLYRIRELRDVATRVAGEGRSMVTARYPHDRATIHLVATHGDLEDIDEVLGLVAAELAGAPREDQIAIELFFWRSRPGAEGDATAAEIARALDGAAFGRPLRRVVVGVSGPDPVSRTVAPEHFTFRHSDSSFTEETLYRGLHPMMGKRLELWRLSNFQIERLPSVEDVYVFHAVARENPKDERLFVLAEVRDLTPAFDQNGRIMALPHLERMLTEALAGIRRFQAYRLPGKRLPWNRVTLYVWPPADMRIGDLFGTVQRLAPLTEGLGLEKVVVRARFRVPDTGEFEERVLHISSPAGRGLALRFDDPSDRPIRPLSAYLQKVVLMRQRGLVYPYEIVRLLTPGRDGTPSDFPPGEFVEYDFDQDGMLRPVARPYGENTANVVVGVIRTFTDAYPEGMARVMLLGDPSHALGSLAEPECRRINAALDLAEELGVPLEWFAVSAGAKISMDSGTENMDWIARTLRRLIDYTQAGGEVNVLVCGINVGAQPYWNAEATMLMHTKGILVMTPDSAMVLTGKQALDYSGGVSADDNFGIGGYDRVMGPNGQAQYWAADLTGACKVLLRHYEHTYVAPGERFPRRVPTSDPVDRDVRDQPHRPDGSSGFTTVGDVFSEETNPGRKKAFDIRSVMRAVADQDGAPLERWPGMRDAESVVVWDTRLGGFPVCMLGIESKPLPRRGVVPADGPEQWTSGTLFPLSSKKAARAVNGASGNRPLVVLANLSGFDGSPESLRNLQLEYGAEIGRAVVNFKGPIVFCVVSRYHGGAFVVFSGTLNEQMEVAAVEGSFASVIGGAPAAAVVFAREVDTRTKADPRVASAEAEVAAAEGAEKARLREELDRVTTVVRSEKLGEVADEFDHVHSVQRALKMGSVQHIVPPSLLRPYLIGAVERGVGRELASPGLEATDGMPAAQVLPDDHSAG
jgi:acetyl-CoA carboxylase carboxyltransferase component/acetyl/propionyl-CoA carboxylase alpha subunit